MQPYLALLELCLRKSSTHFVPLLYFMVVLLSRRWESAAQMDIKKKFFTIGINIK